MNILIWPVAKNPAMGRIGPKEWQDWYRGCAKAVKLERKLSSLGHNVKIAVVSAVHIAGHVAEVYYIMSALNELGARNVHKRLSSYETIGEMESVRGIAQQENAKLIVISTFGHYLRVAWLIRNMNAEHYIAFGLPRWRELITDAILTFLFPIIDSAGQRKWFLNKVVRRRISGKH